MGKNLTLSSSMEDYLEAISALGKDNHVVRVKDISNFMKVETPSVTSALNTLASAGFVLHERYGYVELTSKGEKLAENIRRRHETLSTFLASVLGVKEALAERDACRMEHSVSSKTMEQLTKFIEFVETCPESEGPDWLKSLRYYFKTGRRRKCRVRELKPKR